MNQKLQIKGLWVPLVTPFYEGNFDGESLVNLIKKIEPDVDGFVPCLSSGEGNKMGNELWEKVLKTVSENTTKPIAVGILRDTIEEMTFLSQIAKHYGCIAITLPLQGENDSEQQRFCKEISDKSALPIILYNTEKIHISDPEVLIDISKNENILALKDSSQNKEFFSGAIKIKREGKINISILQGMENQLLESVGCDGYLISLANAEPRLCKEMLDSPSGELNGKIMEHWNEYDLAADNWYVGIKKVLAFRGIIKSAELI